MLRAIGLTFINEFRLLMRDRVGLLMLLLAPIVIIAVAGFSLGNIYGARLTANAYTIPLVDDDHGVVAKAIGDALDHEAPLSWSACRPLMRLAPSSVDGTARHWRL